ncbi:sugar ABC transporter ATP-binding protein [Opitutaceae bacterium EW11]|nr:sugar ABC transporter ATP-binding protein [Opitutaceae bacterium EW11]
MADVVLTQLTKRFSDKSGSEVTAVKGIDLSVADGEFMVLVGPSGCGKSTTLRMIAGLEEISAGTVSIGGRVVNQVLPKDRDIAMVFQNYALYPHMTVFENMAFGLKLRKLPKPEIETRVREAATLLGLEKLLERRPKALSGGQRQRVAVGRAIVRKPKVFLFDEPLSNLDAKMRVSMRAEISKLHQQLGATMIYVTHDQVEAMTMGDRICVMKDGAIMQVAKPLDLYRRPENLFVAGFIGSPPMNLLQGILRTTDAAVEFVESNSKGTPLTLKLPAGLAEAARSQAGKAVVVGLRPEAVTLADGRAASGEVRSFPVELVEPMGAETFLHVSTGAHRLVARLGSEAEVLHRGTVDLQLDLSRAHVFDAASGSTLA